MPVRACPCVMCVSLAHPSTPPLLHAGVAGEDVLLVPARTVRLGRYLDITHTHKHTHTNTWMDGFGVQRVGAPSALTSSRARPNCSHGKEQGTHYPCAPVSVHPSIMCVPCRRVPRDVVADRINPTGNYAVTIHWYTHTHIYIFWCYVLCVPSASYMCVCVCVSGVTGTSR